jgi:hypothetical protein
MQGKDLKATLAKIENGEFFDIWSLLPDIAWGAAWASEIKSAATTWKDYLEDEQDYDIEDLRDYSSDLANNECEDYHNNINRRVQALSLWASNELDDDVEELNSGASSFPTLTDLNTQYLCSAMRILFDAVADQIFQHTDEAVSA